MARGTVHAYLLRWCLAGALSHQRLHPLLPAMWRREFDGDQPSFFSLSCCYNTTLGRPDMPPLKTIGLLLAFALGVCYVQARVDVIHAVDNPHMEVVTPSCPTDCIVRA